MRCAPTLATPQTKTCSQAPSKHYLLTEVPSKPLINLPRQQLTHPTQTVNATPQFDFSCECWLCVRVVSFKGCTTWRQSSLCQNWEALFAQMRLPGCTVLPTMVSQQPLCAAPRHQEPHQQPYPQVQEYLQRVLYTIVTPRPPPPRPRRQQQPRQHHRSAAASLGQLQLEGLTSSKLMRTSSDPIDSKRSAALWPQSPACVPLRRRHAAHLPMVALCRKAWPSMAIAVTRRASRSLRRRTSLPK